MQEFIKMPFWINGWEDIKSNNLNGFKNIISDQEKEKIDLQYLRNYYVENQESFVDVVDELSLRGFEFYNIKPNNLLNKNRYENGEFIIADSNSKFFNIDYETFYISGFLSRFKVESNNFFNYIPLNGFKVLNPEINIEEFKRELYKNGFRCYKYSFGNKNYTIDKVDEIEVPDSCTMEMSDVEVGLKEDQLQIIEDIKSIDNNINKNDGLFDHSSLEEESIEKYFFENDYLTVMKFLTGKGIKSVFEITNQTLIDYCKSRGAGTTKIKNFKLKLIEIYQEERAIIEINYNIFDVDFCFCTVNLEDARLFFKEEININDVSQITDEDLAIFSKKKGVTNRKVELVKEEIAELNKIERTDAVKRKISITFEGYWYEKFKQFKLTEVANILDANLKEDIELTLEEINNECLIELGVSNYKEELSEIAKVFKGTKSIKEIFEDSVNSVKDEKKIRILEYRYLDGETLSEVGKRLDVTRERIRQIQKQTEIKITKYLLSNNLKNALILQNKGRDFCTLKDLSSYIPKGKEYFLNILLANEDTFSLFKPLSLVYFKDYNSVEESFRRLIEDLPEIFLVYDYLDYLTDALLILGLKDPSLEEIEELLINYNYKIYGEYASKVKITLYNALNELFKNYIKVPLRIDEVGAKSICALSKKYLNTEFDSSTRTIEGRIRHNSELVLVDKLTFMHVDNYNFDKECVVKATEILNEIFKTEEMVNIGTVYESNKEEFINGGIENKLALYSLIQYYYQDSFKIGNGNTLDIYRDLDCDIYNREDMLIGLINKNGGKITKEEINDALGWTEAQIENALAKSNEIIRYGKDITVLNEFNVSEEERYEIKQILERLMSKSGFTSTTLLLQEMRFNKKLGPFINRNNIMGYEMLAGIIKKLFNDIKGHSNYIYNKDCKYTNIDEVVKDRFKNRFFRDDVKEFIYSYGYKHMMVSRTINNAIDAGVFIEISSEEFVNVENFSISEDTIYETAKFINNEIGCNDYLSLSNLKGYRRELPSIDFKWNPYLIKSILIRNGFRSVQRTCYDSRFEKVIVVKENSKIESYADLIYSVIEDEYKGNMHETKIYDFLADKGLVLRQEDILDKKIPYDLKVTGRLKIDEVGRVEFL
ncbi:hypothetical protein KPL39_17490 [Clostridium gasigenes]|uniref:sigma factor-like helix-turn-helix DNA-binding protein n=1 Tax=Clostridium gasigenes TaxID=94869 RepID=UPI001C0B0E5B|nr:sigma factor-like helix-turn-helix DNA-binding protein [Clostridium gasigenes]MBU3138028.1 hypothetical protein [Clostridium gasigenes]